MKPRLHILTGPTAVGKTEWALRWAEKNNAEIVSCDSLLFYRGMDIGTAKPTVQERTRVPHHLIDVCDVSERMDITVYIRRARAAIDEIIARNRAVLVTGGSGFYLRSYFAPVADEVDVPDEIRAAVAGLELSEAVARLRELNPQGLGGLDTANPRRVARALERCLASGRGIAELAAEFARRPGAFADFDVTVTVLSREPADLLARVQARVSQMLRDGLVAEVNALRSRGLETNPSAAKAIGYREVLAMLDGRLRVEQLADEMAKNTRALVKKQRTWFRTQLPAHRIVNAADIVSAGALFAP